MKIRQAEKIFKILNLRPKVESAEKNKKFHATAMFRGDHITGVGLTSTEALCALAVKVTGKLHKDTQRLLALHEKIVEEIG